MLSFRCASSLIGVASGLFFLGCAAEDVVEPLATEQRISLVGNGSLKTLDDIYADLGKVVPRFAGMYLAESGTVVVQVTQPGGDQEILSALRAHVAYGAIAGLRDADARGRVQFAAVRFAFADLKRWRDAVYSLRPGVWVEGALQCTLGVNAATDDGTGFLTASHCTDDNWWGTTGARAFYQNSTRGGNLVGFETADPPLLPPGMNCSAPDGCRYSDVAYISYETGVTGQLGLIARTTNFMGWLQ